MEKKLAPKESSSGKKQCAPPPQFPRKTHAKREENGRIAAPSVMRTDEEAWEIVSRNMGLISLGLRKWGLNKFPAEHREDIRSIAKISLFNSAKYWNEKEGKFSTYAISRMRDCIREARDLPNSISLPPHIVRTILSYMEWKSKNPEGSTAHFAEYAGISRTSAENAIALAPIFLGAKHARGGNSFFYGQSLEEESVFSHMEASPSSVSQEIRLKMRIGAEDSLVHENAKAKLLEFIMNSSLAQREKEILEMSLRGNGEQGGLSIAKIAETMGVSQARIGQIIKGAVRKLHRQKKNQLREVLDAFEDSPI